MSRAKGISFSSMIRAKLLGLFTMSERKDSRACESHTAAELLPKLRAEMRPVIDTLQGLDVFTDEQKAAIAEKNGDATAALIDNSTVSSALQGLATDDIMTDVDGAAILETDDAGKAIPGAYVRVPNTARIVRDPWSDTTGRNGSTLFCLREEHERAKAARFETFPEESVSEAAAMEAFTRAIDAAKGDRWAMLSLARSLGVTGKPDAWLKRVREA